MDIVDPDRSIIVNRSFFNVHYVDPAAVTFLNCEVYHFIIRKHPKARLEDSFLEIAVPRYLYGIFMFERCRLESCRFSNITFAGPREFVDGLLEELRRTERNES
jgi:hypothetical protein